MCACGRPGFRRGLCRVCYRLDRHPGPRRPHRRHTDVAEDVEWMLTTGDTHPEAIMARLGYQTLRGVYLALLRAGRPDLVDQLKREGT